MEYESKIVTSKKIKFRNPDAFRSVDAHKKSMPDANFDQQVLFDTLKMFKGAQDHRLSALMREGPKHLSQLKQQKVDPNTTLSEQIFAYRSKLNPFYRTKHINVITEQQVKDGEEVFTFSETKEGDMVRKDYKIDNRSETPRIIKTEHDKT
jgi:hypothetical protein